MTVATEVATVGRHGDRPRMHDEVCIRIRRPDALFRPASVGSATRSPAVVSSIASADRFDFVLFFPDRPTAADGGAPSGRNENNIPERLEQWCVAAPFRTFFFCFFLLPVLLLLLLLSPP